jgi:trehalose 6-phosphate phosphatase
MSSPTELDSPEIDLPGTAPPRKPPSSEAAVIGFLKSVAIAEKSALLLDFDGTLAPFRVDPAAVRPWAHIPKLLTEIQHSGRTRIAIVTGRPAEAVASQLGMHPHPEIWGLHGAERLSPDGKLEREQLRPENSATLNEARLAAHAAADRFRPPLRVEEKWNAVVVHWRGRSAHAAHTAEELTLKLFSPLATPSAGAGGLKLLQFDGGIEVRTGRNKGDAVRLMLNELDHDVATAYLGDDTTDEDAFQALLESSLNANRRLGVLVRREWRSTAAQAWLRPPDQLRSFLASWARAVEC